MKNQEVWGELAQSGKATGKAMQELAEQVADGAVKTHEQLAEIQLFEPVELHSEPLNIETAMQFILDERNEIVTLSNENAEQAEYYEFKYKDLLEQTKGDAELLIKATTLADNHISLRTDYNDLLKKNAGIGDSYKATVTNYELLKGQKATVDAQLKTTQLELKKLKKNSAGHKTSNDTLRKQNARLTKQ